MSTVKSWNRVQAARDPKRSTAKSLIDLMLTDFVELYGDKCYGNDNSIIGGIGFLDGIPVTVIAEEKGDSLESRIYRNFGMPSPEGYRKAQRLMKQAEKFHRPIITIIDTPGAYPGVTAEQRGQASVIAQSLYDMIGIQVPIINIVLSEGGSGGALALGVADRIYMFENAIYSVISPEGFATILFKDSKLASEITDFIKLTAHDLQNFGIIDGIFCETIGNPNFLSASIDSIKTLLISDLDMLGSQKIEHVVSKRYDKFRKIGKYRE
jgi:acetyl-CoA carboxylase carboxyl transferase subunit alpha